MIPHISPFPTAAFASVCRRRRRPTPLGRRKRGVSRSLHLLFPALCFYLFTLLSSFYLNPVSFADVAGESSATMLSHQAKPGMLGKRKDREPSDFAQAQSTGKPDPARMDEPAPAAKGKDNRLLAGLLAHEFLSRGTLLGKQWEPARGAVPRRAPASSSSAAAEAGKLAAYTEVSYLLKADGIHIPGLVNPTQLARWLQR